MTQPNRDDQRMSLAKRVSWEFPPSLVVIVILSNRRL